MPVQVKLLVSQLNQNAHVSLQAFVLAIGGEDSEIGETLQNRN